MDAPLEKRLEELAQRAARSGRACFTRFLEPNEAQLAQAAANRAGARLTLWGGYDDAERRVVAFLGPYDPDPEDWPVQALRLRWNARFASPGHRDLLGAVMGLGIDRDTTGDIAMGEYKGGPCAYLFALEEVAGYIAASLEGAGRASLKVEVAEETPVLLPPEGTEMRLTVQQERLDAVVAAACRLSRAEAQRLVNGGLVKLNHEVNLHTDAKLSEGDVLSVRGHGRLRITAFDGESRRGRQVVRVFKYGK